MSLLIISDTHIQGTDDPLYASLLNLIKTRAQPEDTVVFAGDLFDHLVSKSIYIAQYSDFFSALEEGIQKGIRFHYIEGNHDFHLDSAFRNLKKVHLHKNDVSLEVGGRKFLIAHGDTVDKKDYGYRVLRAFFRSPVMKFFIYTSPGKWFTKFGEFASNLSRNKKPLLPADFPIEKRENLRKIYRSHAAEKLTLGFDYVVMGHCHDLDEMSFSIGGRIGQYINVGYPRAHGSFLSWSTGDEKIQRERLP